MTAPSPPSTSECTLTILMPVRNEGLNLQIMLRMLRGLLDVQHEVLVVHDTLDDNSISVVGELAETLPVRTIHNTYGRGVVNAIRSGVEAATGQYILVLPLMKLDPYWRLKTCSHSWTKAVTSLVVHVMPMAVGDLADQSSEASCHERRISFSGGWPDPYLPTAQSASKCSGEPNSMSSRNLHR
jgi:hypothetical protein